MAGKDKHPPKKVERLKTSTNKKVKAKTSQSVGAPVKTAKGSKKIQHGDGNKTSAKTEPAYETVAARARKERAAKVERNRGGIVYTPDEGVYMSRRKKEFKI